MLEIGFILPSSEYLFDPFRGDPFTHFQILTVLEDSFGESIRARLIDLRGIKREFALYHIPECDVYLHSVYTLDYEEQVALVRALRARYPAAIHIAGGPHANAFPDECLEVFEALVVGEGEEAVTRAVKDVMQAQVERVYRQEGPIDINAYPHWRREYLPRSAVARRNMLTLKKNGAMSSFSERRCCSAGVARIDVASAPYSGRERMRRGYGIGLTRLWKGKSNTSRANTAWKGSC